MQEAFSVMEGGLLLVLPPFRIASAGKHSFLASGGTSAWGRTLSSRDKSGEDSSVTKTFGTVGCDNLKSVGGEDNSKDEGNEGISDSSSYTGGEAAAIGLGQGGSSTDAKWENTSSSESAGEAGEIMGAGQGDNEGSGEYERLRLETLEKERVGDAGGVIGVHVSWEQERDITHGGAKARGEGEALITVGCTIVKGMARELACRGGGGCSTLIWSSSRTSMECEFSLTSFSRTVRVKAASTDLCPR